MLNRIQELPFFIQRIYAETQQNSFSTNLKTWVPTWQAYAQNLSVDIPGVQVESQGACVHLGELSPGCLACHQGAWDCIFVTPHCNLGCAFCISPYKQDSPDGYFSALGSNLSEITRNYLTAGIWGIGLSGGEPFLRFERFIHLVRQLRESLPQAYLWAYTNGLLVQPFQLDKLKEAGLDELRFNLAASHYIRPAILEKVYLSSTLGFRVTVEIPVLPEDENQIQSALVLWEQAGVRHLNFHELMYEPGTVSNQLAGPRECLINEDGHHTWFNPESRRVTRRIMQYVKQEGLTLAVNDCSLFSKIEQVRKRRKAISRILLGGADAHEMMEGDNLYSTICVIRDREHFQMIHPGQFTHSSDLLEGCRVLKLSRLAPLSISEPPNWLEVDELLS